MQPQLRIIVVSAIILQGLSYNNSVTKDKCSGVKLHTSVKTDYGEIPQDRSN